ncbi:MAG TPA: hypothetical protein VH080_11055, partial [Gemmatimonadaceae bacterium]|nr:hypothetical protein [Gemmatimonadaceae bacterium]
ATVVHEENGQSIVWLVRDGRLESRVVEAGPSSAGYREIRKGLSGGEMLLSGGIEQPHAGMRVSISKS